MTTEELENFKKRLEVMISSFHEQLKNNNVHSPFKEGYLSALVDVQNELENLPSNLRKIGE
jgi:hypothetical protein